LVNHATRRFHRKLGRARKSIHKKFLVNIQMRASIEEVKSYMQKKGVRIYNGGV
jgi:hypothetical protein